MADTNAVNICVQIIESHFGPLTAAVTSALLNRGRLSLGQIIRAASVKARTARAAVLVLIQHNLAWQTRSNDGEEIIEFNIDECLMRLRLGRFVWLADQLFGPAAAEIVSIILDHGKLRVPDVMARISSGKEKELSVYAQIFHTLVTKNYLKPSTTFSHLSPKDKLMQYETETRKEIKNFPTAKELREAKEKAEARFKREQQEAENVGLIKRKVNEKVGHRQSKKRAIEEEVVDESVYFRVNSNKFNIHIRNALIEEACQQRFNESAGAVMRAVLKATESAQSELSDLRSEPVTLAGIASFIPDDEDLAAGLHFGSSKTPSTMGLIKEYLGLLSAADNPTPAGRAGSFLSFIGSNSGKVQVEFETVCKRLRQGVLEAVAREKYGDDGVRIIRFLLEVGKMGGDQLAKMAMMANKDVRPLLTSMSEDNFVRLQDIPKGADRNPTRTFYVWHVDLPRAHSVILRNLYRTLLNIISRRRAEEEDPTLRAVLEKCERTDVQEDKSLLNRNEREALKTWEEKRDKLVLLEMRIEEMVFIIRDLGTLATGEES